MRRTTAAAVAGAALALLAAGCGGAAEARPATPATPAPASTPATAAGPAAVTPSAPAVPSTPAPPVRLSRADLDAALLGVADLPTGYALATRGGAGKGVVTAALPSCAGLPGLLDGGPAPGSLASSGVAFDGGTGTASFDEQLDAYADAGAAARAVRFDVADVRSCPQVSVRVPGYGRAVFAVAQPFLPTSVGYMTRLTATGKALEGLEVLLAGVATGAVVVHVLTSQAPAEDGRTLWAAVATVRRTVGGSNA